VAAAAGVTVEPLASAALTGEAERLLMRVWRADDTEPPMTAHMMRALAFTGGYAVGAFDDAGTMLGVCAGFVTAGPRPELHSHIAGVLDEARRRGLGFVLKQHQRAWALEHGIDLVSWTFDPLVRRNTWFNLGKLGAAAKAYLPDFYGPMHDELNAGEPSDRLLVHWELRSEVAVAAAAGRPAQIEGAHVTPVVSAGSDGRPVVAPDHDADSVLVALPQDIEQLRAVDPEGASAWRAELRQALAPRLDAGWHVLGCAPEGLVLRRS